MNAIFAAFAASLCFAGQGPAAGPQALEAGLGAFCTNAPAAGVVLVDARPGEERYRLAGLRVPAAAESHVGRKAAEASMMALWRLASHRRVRVVAQAQVAGDLPAALVYLESDGRSLNEAIIAAGLAFFQPADELGEPVAGLLRAAEAEARALKLGFWKPVDLARIALGSPEVNRDAEALLKVGDRLISRHPEAARGCYSRVVAQHPRSWAAVDARNVLGLPAYKFEVPELTADLAMELIPRLDAATTFERPDLPQPPPDVDLASEAERPKPEPTGPDVVQVEAPKPRPRAKPSSATFSPLPDYSGSSFVPHYGPRRTPGTQVHVRSYYRGDGTYVRQHTRSAPRRR